MLAPAEPVAKPPIITDAAITDTPTATLIRMNRLRTIPPLLDAAAIHTATMCRPLHLRAP